MPLWESFLVRDDEVGFCRPKPAGENAFEKDVGIKPWLAWEKLAQWRNRSAMRYGDLKSSRREGVVDQIHVAVESHAIGAGDDIDCWCHGL